MVKHGATKTTSGSNPSELAKHDVAKGASGSNPFEEVTQRKRREEQVDPVIPRRERSKDMISTSDSRLTQVEEDVSGMEAQVDDLGQRVEGLEAEDVVIHTVIKGMVVQLEESLRGEMAKICEEFMGELTKICQVYKKELNSMLARIEEMHEDLPRCKRALAMGADTNSIVKVKRIEVPKPKSFHSHLSFSFLHKTQIKTCYNFDIEIAIASIPKQLVGYLKKANRVREKKRIAGKRIKIVVSE
ncbi:hypothetical protein ACLB2K_040956 [Fragaria x ananassa]